MDYCASPKVLLLGISYPDVKGHMAKHNYAHDILQHSEASVDQAVECVRRKILTEMDGRDLARVVATEQAGGGHEVYTVSKELGGIYRKDRHVYASFNNSRGMRKAMAKAFGHVRFQQVILDYYWMPTGWLVTRWAKTLFQETLPDLVKHDMLAYPGSRTRSPKKATPRGSSRRTSSAATSTTATTELEEGVVFLPFCAHVCKELVGGIDKLKPYFAITFVKKSELPGHALWKGTMAIDGNVMQHRLGKRLDQEEIYCTFQPKDIYESMEDAHVNKDEVMQMLLSIEDFENIRMIRLRPLRQHEPPSLFRKVAQEPETGGFIGLNWEKGRQRFKEYRRRGKNKPLPPPPPPPTSRCKPKAKAKRGRKASTKHDPGSDVETVASDTEDTYSIVDTYSDSSSDEEEEEEDAPEEQLDNPSETGFDPLSNPAAIPQVTHYFPYPALDLTSYMISKDVLEKDKVMAYYDKTWGPKSSRKKNKKQDIVQQDFRRFQKTQRDYLSSNPRRPPKESVVVEDGYTWTMVGSDSDCEQEETEEKNQQAAVGYERDGWRLSLKGDDPDSHLVPRIIQLAKRDNERTASLQLFEMKNPGFKKYSRTWANNGSYMSCYQIPKHAVLMKMDAAEKSMGKKESKIISDDEQIFQQQDNGEDNESDDDLNDERESIGGEADPASSSLLRFADIAATAPILSDEFRLICQESKGLFDDARGEHSVEGLKPKIVSDSLPYDLSPHNNFPRELFRLLQDAEERILEHVVCWQKRGRSFIIKNHEQFENNVLRRCCNDTTTTMTLQSFLSTIMSYGFCEIKRGKRKGGYRHNLFQRGKPKRLDQLVREGIDHVPFCSQDDKSVEMADADQMVAEHKPVVEERNTASGITSRRLFISNLYHLLKTAKRIGFDNVIYWETSGKSFKVHKLDERFCSRILPNYFSMPCYRSFKRELIDHGFKCKEGGKYGVFEHPNFVRDERVESGSFERIKLKRKRNIEPDTKPTPEPEAASPLNDTNKRPKLKRRKLNIEPKRAKDSKSTKTQTEAPNEKSTKGTKTELEAPNEKSRKIRKKYKLRRNIPEVIYEMLEDSVQEGFSESIRWLPKGDGLFINEPSYFETNFLHKYTEIKRFSTFEAHLERVGFEKSAGPKSGTLFKHQHFVRGQEEKLSLVTKSNDQSASKSRNADNVRPSRKSTSAAKDSSKAIISPDIDSGNDKGETTDIVCTERKHEGKNSLDSTRINGSSPETLLASPEKENSDLRLASNSIPIPSANNTHRVNPPPAINSLPGQPTERELFPLSAVNSRKTNESTKQPHNILSTTGDKNGVLLPKGVKCKARPRKSLSTTGDKNGILSPSGAVKSKARSQKRTTRSKKGETPPKVARNGAGHKPTGRKKKSIVAGKMQTPVTRRTLRSADSDSRDSSAHDRNISPTSGRGRGLRSSSKVCGKSLYSMDSMATSSLCSRHLSKCNLEDEALNPRPLPWKGMRDQLMLPLPPPTTPDFPVDRGSDRQIMANLEATRLELSGIVYRAAEENQRSTQTVSGLRGQTDSIVISPPPEEDPLQAISDTFEGKFGLSLGGFTALIAYFSSLYGAPRANALQEIFFWQAGFPQPCQDQIKLLAEWIIPSFNTSSSVMMCLLVEVCSYEFAIQHGDDWHDHCVTIIQAIGANSPPMLKVRKKVREICNSYFAELVGLEQRMLSAARNHDLQHILRRAQRSDEAMEEAMEEAFKHHINQQQEKYGSHHSHIGIGNSNESLINCLRGYNYKPHVNDREQTHERTPTTRNSIYYSSHNTDNNNGHPQHHRHHISTTPTMQQLCMQPHQQHPFGELICQGKSEFIQQSPMGY